MRKSNRKRSVRRSRRSRSRRRTDGGWKEDLLKEIKMYFGYDTMDKMESLLRKTGEPIGVDAFSFFGIRQNEKQIRQLWVKHKKAADKAAKATAKAVEKEAKAAEKAAKAAEKKNKPKKSPKPKTPKVKARSKSPIKPRAKSRSRTKSSDVIRDVCGKDALFERCMTNKCVKKDFHKLMIKYHPDKSHLNKDITPRHASICFRKVKEKYDKL